MEPDFPRQRPCLAGRPELLDVARIVVATVGNPAAEFFLMAVASAADRAGPLPTPHSPVSPKHHHLIARKQIGETRRLHIVELDTGTCGQCDVGEDGAGDLPAE